MSDVHVITLAAAERPDIRTTMRSTGGMVVFGTDNAYPGYLLRLFDNSAKHGAIVAGKVTYIAGNGFSGGEEDPATKLFVDQPNPSESLAHVTRKVALDLELFGGAYLEVIWNGLTGRIAEVYHLPYETVRTNEDNTQFWYHKNWRNNIRGAVPLAAFNPLVRRGKQVLFLKRYRPGNKAYPLPDYMGALDYIEADVQVGQHTNNNAKGGFTASKLITLVEGEAEPDKKRAIEKGFERVFTGSGGKKFALQFVNDATRKAIIDDLGASDLTKEDFTAVDGQIQQNIYAGHSVTSPALFGIAEPGKLGGRQELRDAYEVFKNTYVNDRQQFIEQHYNALLTYWGGRTPVKFIPLEPVGIEFSEAIISANMSRAEIRERAGLPAEGAAVKTAAQTTLDAINGMSPLVANKVLEALTPNEVRSLAALPSVDGGDTIAGPDGAAVQPVQQDETNQHLRGMGMRELNRVRAIAQKVKDGKMAREEAAMLLTTAWGLTEEQVAVLLGPAAPAAMSAAEDFEPVLAVFAAHGVPRAGAIILKTRRAAMLSAQDADDYEDGDLATDVRMAAATLSTLEANILGLLDKDPRMTPEVIAKTLRADKAVVARALRSLLEGNAIIESVDATGLQRKLAQPLRELTDNAVPRTSTLRVVYSYEGPQDARNRPFCARLMELDRLYTRKDIEAISERLGYSVWDRRGGFWTHAGTGETTPYCRHRWVSHVAVTNS